jgi:hypothetical protein
MEDMDTRFSGRLELRVIHSASTLHDAWVVVTGDAHTINFPVHLQLGKTLTALVDDSEVGLREGRLFVYDSGAAPQAASTGRKPSFGVVHYLGVMPAEGESLEQFHVKLYLPPEKFRELWELCAHHHLPRMITLQVKGFNSESNWDIAATGQVLLVEDFMISLPII